MEDGIFFNQSKYIKEMLKKFGLEDSKPTKTPMSTEIKFTKDDEANFVDSSKYRDGSGIMMMVVAWQQRGGDSGEEMERVRESGYGDRIDRKMGLVFGVGRKIPPEKFSGGGATAAAVAGRQPEFMGEREEEDEVEVVCVCINEMEMKWRGWWLTGGGAAGHGRRWGREI
ncbi:hypothetical protein Tco_0867503, partial [Tanacetum coccineum]